MTGQIVLTGIVSIPFLQKSRFTGSYGKFNYLLEKGTDPASAECLKVVYWKGPYNFLTSTEEKIEHYLTFDEDGLMQAQVWLNERCQKRSE